MKYQCIKVSMIPSLNKFLRSRSMQMSGKWKNDMWIEIKNQKIRPIERYPIDIVIQGFFSGRRFDTTNCIMTWKILEDMLVKAKILVNDSPRYVRDILIRQARRSETNQDAIVCYLCEGADVPRTTMAALYI